MLKEITPANKAKTTTLDGNNRDHGSMIQTTLLHNPVLVPIPLHWWRERQRWFNQSELLAREIGTQLSLAVQTDILIRSKKTAPQAGKKRAERMRSMQGVFTLQTLKKHQKLPHSIILLDDVWTTGATMREAARTLKRAGVTQVWGLTLAG
jgi:ComF family protein